ncbi:peptidase [Candidatus Fermentibacteria bacterium]|nr:MAG: peptidase [Candidatus Fermentibacteria bacterium]
MNKIELKGYRDLFKGYTELRVQENRNIRIFAVNGTVMGNSRTSESGVSARCWKNGSWGFSSSPEMNDAALKQVIASASYNASFLDSKTGKGLGSLPSVSRSAESDFSFKGTPPSQKQLIDFVMKIDGFIEKNYSKLISRTVVLSALDMEKQIITSTGSEAWSMTPRSLIYIILSAESSSGPVELSEAIGGLGQTGELLKDSTDFRVKLDVLYEHLMKKAEGVHAESGIADVILDADLAGILSHEAIGHTTEADLVKGGSVAGDYMGEKVASELVTLVDYASTAHGKTCPVPVYVDDEGTPARDAVIIKDGVLKSYMHNRESAMEFGVEPTGNARGYRFSDEPLIRMRNTAIVPGSSSLQEMISSVEDGYYLIKSSNGQADSTSEFMFGVTMGYEIKKGKLGRALKDMTISGIAFDVLKTVTAVSSDMKWDCSGMCGKKQPIPVGMGGPAIKCRVNIGGK